MYLCYLGGDVTLEIYFACWFFLASVYADKPLKLVQEEFHCEILKKIVFQTKSMTNIWNNHLIEYSSNQFFRMYWKAIEQARERSF
jgi:hypothetical protein